MKNVVILSLKFLFLSALLLEPSFVYSEDFEAEAEAEALAGTKDGDAVIYFLTGGIWDWMNPPAVHRAFQAALKEIKDLNPQRNLLLAKVHQKKHRTLCKALIETKARNPDLKIILLGHSYGGVEVLGISRCLQKADIYVNLAITVDTVPKWIVKRKNATLVPENVLANFHYYTRADYSFFFSSAGRNISQADSPNLVRNYKIDLKPIPFVAHMSVPVKLLSSGVPQSLIQATLDGRTPVELEADHAELHEAFFTPVDEAPQLEKP